MAVKLGDVIHGFANGYFGHDSYKCRVVVHIGPDYIVTRSEDGPEFLCGRRTLAVIHAFGDNHDHCSYECEGPSFYAS